MQHRFTDNDETGPFERLSMWRAGSRDPRVVLVRAHCRCGWLQTGDPSEVLGAMAEHFRGHWTVQGRLPTMGVEEDVSAEAEVRQLTSGDGPAERGQG